MLKDNVGAMVLRLLYRSLMAMINGCSRKGGGEKAELDLGSRFGDY